MVYIQWIDYILYAIRNESILLTYYLQIMTLPDIRFRKVSHDFPLKIEKMQSKLSCIITFSLKKQTFT